MRIFGFEFGRQEEPYLKKDQVSNDSISFVDRQSDSTAAVVYATPMSTGSYVDINGSLKTESEFINKYREMAGSPEIDNAIAEIVNQAICMDKDFVVKIDLDEVMMLDDDAKVVIKQQFNEVLRLYDFKALGYKMFERWYTDGRLYYHAVIDPKRPEEGIKELRYVDPRKIREIKEVQQKKVTGGTAQQMSEVQITKNEYYLYNEKGFTPINKGLTLQNATTGGIKISKDSVIHVPSGLTDVNGSIGLSYLHKAILDWNKLRTLEDSMIIYRLARAPERRVWEVDVANMPPAKAQQHLQQVMDLQKNRLIYDSTSGTIRDDRKFPSMLEDFYLPKWADGRGMKVSVLEGGRNLDSIADIEYFQKKLYNALNVPTDRLQPDTPFAGNTQEISRVEIKFMKFIDKLRQQFSMIFTLTLERHLVLKGLMTIEEFQAIAKDINYEYAEDQHFTELIDQQIIQNRVTTFMALQQANLIGTVFSMKYVLRNVFMQTNEDVIEMTQDIMEEMNNPLYSFIYAAQFGAGQQQGDPNGEGQDGGQPQGGPTAGELQQQSGGNKYMQNANKLDNSKHIVQALRDVKDKTPDEIKKLRSAAQVIAKAKSDKSGK